MGNFEKFGFNETLINNLKKQGIKTPTPVQDLTMDTILAGNDIIAEAQTGTGKTLAFLLPMFQNLKKDTKHVQGLVLTPTRELALQITEEAKKLAIDSDVKILAVYGGQDLGSQLKKLNKNVDLIIATPGRLIDHMSRENIDLSHLTTFVIDEADQMFHYGFKNEIETILKKTNPNRQLLCFSATLDSKIKKLAYRYMNNPNEMLIKKETVTLDTIDQKVVKSSDRWKMEALMAELDKSSPYLAIIFCRTKRRADKLEHEMSVKKYNCAKLHGDMPQSARQRSMKSFRTAKIQYLIATDVASRGLDVTGVTHIYNYDIPETSETYIHRIGRTGRMGETGSAITFVTPKDEDLLKEIEFEIDMNIRFEEYINVANREKMEIELDSEDDK